MKKYHLLFGLILIARSTGSHAVNSLQSNGFPERESVVYSHAYYDLLFFDTSPSNQRLLETF